MGWGYGYPYFGASASLYYGGYRPQPRVYQGRPVGVASLEARVQQRLAAEGYYRGAIDGIVGAGTRAAIRAYQRDRGLRVTGRIDNRLLAQLGVR
jgi:peptidoglycan hydrolase-like protein with peptidoglycan-binding domain